MTTLSILLGGILEEVGDFGVMQNSPRERGLSIHLGDRTLKIYGLTKDECKAAAQYLDGFVTLTITTAPPVDTASVA